MGALIIVWIITVSICWSQSWYLLGSRLNILDEMRSSDHPNNKSMNFMMIHCPKMDTEQIEFEYVIYEKNAILRLGLPLEMWLNRDSESQNHSKWVYLVKAKRFITKVWSLRPPIFLNGELKGSNKGNFKKAIKGILWYILGSILIILMSIGSEQQRKDILKKKKLENGGYRARFAHFCVFEEMGDETAELPRKREMDATRRTKLENTLIIIKNTGDILFVTWRPIFGYVERWLVWLGL